MFRFEDPIYFWLLLVIPFLVLIFFWSEHLRRSKLKKFGDRDLIRQLMPDRSRFRPLVKFCMLIVALALLIVMLARPQLKNGKPIRRIGLLVALYSSSLLQSSQ